MLLVMIVAIFALIRIDSTLPISDCGKHPKVYFNSNENLLPESFSQNPINNFQEFIEFLKQLGEQKVNQVYNDIKKGIEAELTCRVCKVAIGVGKSSTFLPISAWDFVLKEICSTFKIEDKSVCDGLSTLYTKQLHFIIKHTNLTTDEVCAILIGPQCMTESCTKQTNSPIKSFPQPQRKSLSLKETNLKSNALLQHDSIEKNRGSIKRPQKNILHLSDIHFDQFYEYGASSDCGEPLCCRATSPHNDNQKKANNSAGYFGDYLWCDSPGNTIEDMLRYINTTLYDDFSMVIWTGDTTPHDVWNTTKSEIVQGSRRLSSLIKTYLSDSKLVFPVIGNHEGLPVNQFAPPEITDINFSIGWLYEELSNQWKDWIPSQSIDLFKLYGYYSNDVSPTFKVIALNTNYCARLNFWLMYDPNDPGDQLKWLARELNQAEANGQKVHIIGHHPPDNQNCIQQWVHNYMSIIERYQNIITAQFFGHTHFDEFRILYSSDKKTPVSVAYLGPSVTPYDMINPAFRLYTIDESSSIVLDHETHYLNLTDANANRKFKPLLWLKEYSAKSAYDLTSLSASEWNLLYGNMFKDEALFQAYYKNYHRYSDAMPASCNASCKDSILGNIPIYDPISC